jgi:hypothetical protein
MDLPCQGIQRRFARTVTSNRHRRIYICRHTPDSRGDGYELGRGPAHLEKGVEGLEKDDRGNTINLAMVT